MAGPKLHYVPNSQLPQARALQPGRKIQPSDQGRANALAAAVDRALAPDTQLGHDITVSRLAAPGPGISGYGFLSTLAGRNLAAQVPGTQDWTGARPQWTNRGVFQDLLQLSPYMRGERAWYEAIKAARAGQTLPEVLVASRVRNPLLGPVERIGARVYAPVEAHAFEHIQEQNRQRGRRLPGFFDQLGQFAQQQASPLRRPPLPNRRTALVGLAQPTARGGRR